MVRVIRNQEEDIMSQITLTVDLQRNSAGRYDHERTLSNFSAALVKHESERELEESTVRDTLNGIFDQYKGTAITMPTLEGMVCRALNAQPANWQTLADRASAFVRENSQETTDKLTKVKTLHPESLFVIQKGKHGGVLRRADIPAKPVTGAPAAPVAEPVVAAVAPGYVPEAEGSDNDNAEE